MIDTKLILIEGVPGTGKSSAAQYLHLQFRRNGIKAKWFHEEEKFHPLFYPDINIEMINWESAIYRFIEKWPIQWERLVTTIEHDDKIWIIESYLFQNGVRVLLNNNIDRKIIDTFTARIFHTISHLHPILIYFHVAHVANSLRRIWRKRGDEWKQYRVSTDEQTPFAVFRGLRGENASFTLWSSLQHMTNQLLSNFEGRVVTIETTEGWWREYRRQICRALELEEKPHLQIKEQYLDMLTGTYREPGENGLVCTIKRHNSILQADFLWPDLDLIPCSNRHFYVRSMPFEFKFETNDKGEVDRVFITGAEMYDLKGRELIKTIDRTIPDNPD